jgi:pimeloyl-ACP methyl ester carboxylesterase
VVGVAARRNELRAAGRLFSEATGGLIGVISQVQHAVMDRMDALLPTVARPVTAAQRALTDWNYGVLGLATWITPRAGAELLSWTGDPDRPALASTAAGRMALAAVNGIWGDLIAERYPELAIATAVRSHGRDLELDAASVAAAFPAATGRLVVFLPGLCESEDVWRRHDHPEDDPDEGGSYGERLTEEFGITPVYVRYNTGMRIAANGEEVADLIDRLTAVWPVPVDRIDLVGHSMGGLVARVACHRADSAGQPWAAKVRVVVNLGSPHLGAPLAKGVQLAARLMTAIPETAPFSRILGTRSAGVHDLQDGGAEAAEGVEVPFLPHVTYCFVAATLTQDLRHPLGHLVGDGLVRFPSAAGADLTRKVALDFDHGAHVGGIGHFSLLGHHEVHHKLREWLA